MGIKICLPKSRYLSTDVDNMTKTIMDAFCGIAYEDDKQIDSLFVSKSAYHKSQVWIGLKSLGQGPKSWFLPPLLIVPDKADPPIRT